MHDVCHDQERERERAGKSETEIIVFSAKRAARGVCTHYRGMKGVKCRGSLGSGPSAFFYSYNISVDWGECTLIHIRA